MNLQSSTLKDDESGEPLHIQQRKQIEAFRDAWKRPVHSRTPRVSVSRSIFPLVNDRDFAYFGQENTTAIRSASSTRTRAPSLAALMSVNPMYWPRNSPETRRLPRQIPCL
jgi:hypothetical protein